MAIRKEELENPVELLNQMFNEYQLDEYLPAWEAMKAEWDRVCKDNYNFRMVKRDGKDAA